MSNKLNLQNTTLLAIDTVESDRSLFGLEQCLRHADFGAVKFLTSHDTDKSYAVVIPQEKVIDSSTSYSEFIYLSLVDYVDTDFVMICQWDGWIVDPSKFTHDFYQYDYIGNYFPWTAQDDPLRLMAGGNGGFSLRSRRLLEWSSRNKDIMNQFRTTKYYFCEDLMFSVALFRQLKSAGLRVSSPTVAQQWGIQGMTEYHKTIAPTEVRNNDNCFGQHQSTAEIPIFPETNEPSLFPDLTVVYGDRNVTEHFRYYWPVWRNIGWVTCNLHLLSMIFLGDFFREKHPTANILSFHVPDRVVELQADETISVSDLIDRLS